MDDELFHKELFPLSIDDYAMLLATSIGLAIAAGGGIGGGGILVPIYILVGKFPPSLAVPLSNVTILGGAVGNFYFNSVKVSLRSEL
tara:strand:- start:59 stop:319 length:261 start_codon:yes stop_codon:yes gene_type:complete